MKNKIKYISYIKYIFFVITLNIIVRLPSVFQELPPYSPVDENIFVDKAFRHYQIDRYYINRVNQIVYYLASAPSYLYSVITGEKVSKSEFTIFARLFCPVLMNSISSAFIFLIAIILFKSKLKSFLISMLYSISPLIMGLSRMVYPDYILILSSSTILLLCFLKLKKDSSTFIILSSITISIATSIKIHGLSLVAPCLIVIIYPLFAKNESISKNKLIHILKQFILIFLLIIIFFILINPIIWLEGLDPFKEYIEWKDSLYTKEELPFLQTNNSYLFYLMLMFIVSYGWIGFIFVMYGINYLYKENPLFLILLLICPFTLIFILGGYTAALTRNVIIGIPFIFFIMILGLDYFLKRLKNSYLKYIVIILIILEPGYKTSLTILNDLRIDSRIKSEKWIEQNLPQNSTVSLSRYLKDPFLEKSLPDFLVLDSWYSDMYKANCHKSKQKSTIIFTEPIFNNLHYINAGAVFYKRKFLLYQKKMKDYMHIKTIEGYGPDIFIYENINKNR